MVRLEPASVSVAKFESSALRAIIAALETEGRRTAGCRRHRVGDEEQLAPRLGGERDFQRHRIDMMAIGDETAPALAIGERRAHHARARARLARSWH